MELLFFIPALRVILGFLFIISSALKIPNLKGFSGIVAAYGILPRKLVKPLAYAQPIFELIIGAWILSGKYLLFAATFGLIMMLVTNVFVFTAYFRKKKLANCGCYGVDIAVPLTWKRVLENIIWTLLFIFLIICAHRAWTIGFT